MTAARNTPASALKQRPRPGGTRCPYCHEGCDASQDACACAECLSRHHRECWDESQGCSSCGANARLEARAAGGPSLAVVSTGPDYGEVLDAWLRLGGFYNGALALLTVGVLQTRVLSHVVQLGLGALLANLLFLIGPALEIYARRFGLRETHPLRLLLFIPGLVLGLGLALANCITLLGPLR
ncbi:MAG: hypothetical protein AB7N76_35920 [Planctomycetota bacterium]